MDDGNKESYITCFECQSENLQIHDEKEKDTGGQEVLADCPNPICSFDRGWWQRSSLEEMQQDAL